MYQGGLFDNNGHTIHLEGAILNNPTVSSAYLKSFYMSALQFGVPKKNLPDLPDGGIAGLDIRTRRYPAQTLFDVIGAGYQHTKDPSIGLRFGLNLRPERNIDVIYALTFCQDLREAMELNIAYQPLIQQIGSTELLVTDEAATCIWTPRADNTDLMPFMTEAAFAGYASIGRWLLWINDPPIERMCFRHSRPDNIDTHVMAFGENLFFDQDRDEMVIRRDAFNVLLAGRNPNMVKRLTIQLDQMLENLDNPNNLIEDVKSQIRGDLGKSPVNISTIGKTLGISERTLRRRLSAENTSFRDLLNHCRKNMTEIYMADERMTLAQIAHALGFSDQSAFSRAFKDWFKQTPLQYRSTQNRD